MDEWFPLIPKNLLFSFSMRHLSFNSHFKWCWHIDMSDMVVIVLCIIGPSGEILFFYLDLLQGGQRSNFYSRGLKAGWGFTVYILEGLSSHCPSLKMNSTSLEMTQITCQTECAAGDGAPSSNRVVVHVFKCMLRWSNEHANYFWVKKHDGDEWQQSMTVNWWQN